MLDSFGRQINYLRISVTDRCNLRCHYCMPSYGVDCIPHKAILSFEEIEAVVRMAVELGISKVRLTGGEPLVRRDIIKLVAMLAGVDGITDLAMTTNGLLLGIMAADLAAAGLQRVNISLDTLDPERFAAITGGGDVSAVLRGIAAAHASKLTPIKINCVVEKSRDEKDAMAVAHFGEENGMEVRFIQRMNFGSGTFAKIDGGDAGECAKCNRLRLLSDGRILPCLFSDRTFSVIELGAKAALMQAVLHKPDKGRPCAAKWMHSVGG